MGQLEQHFKTASLELIEIRNQKQEFDRELQDHAGLHQQLDSEL